MARDRPPPGQRLRRPLAIRGRLDRRDLPAPTRASAWSCRPGYSQRQIEELRATIDAADCDVVVAGTPIGLRRVVGTTRPIRQACYELRELGHPDLEHPGPHPGRGQARPPVATAR